MNISKKLICVLAAGATLGAAAPVFADQWHDRGYDHHESYRDHDRHEFREHGRYEYRDYGHRNVVVVERPYVVQRPYIVEQPYYAPPMVGPAEVIGATLGGIIDRRY